MSDIAVGVYFKTLRNKYGWSQQKVADLASAHLGKSITKTPIFNLENGNTWPDGETFTVLINILQANIAHVIALQMDKNATEEQAKAMAEEWFDREQLGRLDHIIANTKPDQYAAILADVRRELLRDPNLEPHLRGLLSRR